MTRKQYEAEITGHVDKVKELMRDFINRIVSRSVKHDKLKLESPEAAVFMEHIPKLANTTYGSEDYYSCLKEMQPALDHHYANYRHHPEHFENGVSGMTLVDLVEMFCDWKASNLRQQNTGFIDSIEQSAKRFHIDDQLKQILINTANMGDE